MKKRFPLKSICANLALILFVCDLRWKRNVMSFFKSKPWNNASCSMFVTRGVLATQFFLFWWLHYIAQWLCTEC